MKIRSSMYMNQISVLRGWRDRLPVVVMSIVLSVANACLAVSFKLPAPEYPTECLGWLSRSILAT